ncbi:MAG: GNAT superfamily N-acetyltransferase [Chlamydiales bacterium]|jgi:GNAT superfamily N-acetyltransferase
MNFTIRKTSKKDIPLILEFIKEIAAYEKLSHQVTATETILEESLFGETPQAKVFFGEEEGIPVSYAVYFFNFSTFDGRHGLYLEDLFVKPEHRGKGYGKALLKHLGKIAKEKGCLRMEWSVLDWNKSAIDFYESLGAKPMDGWTVYRCTGEALQELADEKHSKLANNSSE